MPLLTCSLPLSNTFKSWLIPPTARKASSIFLYLDSVQLCHAIQLLWDWMDRVLLITQSSSLAHVNGDTCPARKDWNSAADRWSLEILRGQVQWQYLKSRENTLDSTLVRPVLFFAFIAVIDHSWEGILRMSASLEPLTRPVHHSTSTFPVLQDSIEYVWKVFRCINSRCNLVKHEAFWSKIGNLRTIPNGFHPCMCTGYIRK